MSARAFLAAVVLAAASGAASAETIGIYSGWGAFAKAGPMRCYAIARPVGRRGGEPHSPFASVATWPASGIRDQLHIRLSRTRAEDAAVTLSIGERHFELAAGAVDAWAPDAKTDRAIVGAMRSGRSMSVESVSRGGRPFADVYALDGAATAIDAATVACVARRSGGRT
ncbi:hypothetical protein [Stakelama saccharophila]|uniref:Mlr4354 like protein n=1 Tax=Stakelama saccharophila TaxID=3075605 RepID=A0ABZ0B9U3_9SPHN|nr:hypothetical protein [Stakelama sp. W311]WNO54170.1 hypothetical protein RPR59_02605 [Stakelama sp. W311]